MQYKWNVEDMQLMNEKCNVFIGIEKIHNDGNDEMNKYISMVGKSQDGLITLMNINGIVEI